MGAGWRLWRGLLLLALGALAAVYVAVLVRYFLFPYGDLGWAIDHIVWNAWQMASGQPVYTDPHLGDPAAFMYTPGFTFLCVPLVAVFGPVPWTARLVHLIGAVLLVVLVTRETAGRVSDRRLAAFAPGLVILLGSLNFSTLIEVNPEVWAVAFALLALRATQRVADGGRGLAAAVLCSFAAVATKQTMLAYVPVAALVLLAARGARAATLYAAGVAVLLGAGAALGQWATGGWFLRYVLLGARHELLWGQLPAVLVFMAEQLLPYLLVLGAAALWGRARPPGASRPAGWLRDAWALALVVEIALQPIVLLKRGDMPNHFLGVSMLLVPLLLAAVEALLPRLRERRALAASLGALALGWVGLRLAQDVPPLWRHLESYDDRVAVVRRLETIVRESHGSAWVPMGISLAYRNGAPVIAPALILAEFLPAMPEVVEPVLARLERAEFETIVLPNPASFFSLLPEAKFRPRLDAHYRIAEVVGTDTPMGALTPFVVMRRVE